MTHKEYWLECLACSLDELGIFDILTGEQKQTIASDMENAHENYGMAFGHDCIQNPLLAEIERIKRDASISIELEERRAESFKRQVCRIAHVDPKDVYEERIGEEWILKSR